MSAYLLINILIVIIPLLMSFERKIKFYKNYNNLTFSMFSVGVPFLIWDIIAENKGDWMFNNKFICGLKIFNLPIEEILFFITVPYSIMFLYETFIYYLTPKKISFNRNYLFLFAIIFLITAIIYYQQNYTFTVFLFLSILLLLVNISKLNFIKNQYLIYFIFFTFVPFFAVNYFLTSLPVVIYNSKAILGIRITTIPLEDFFYSLCLIIGYLFTYEFAKEKWQVKSVR